MIKKKQRIEMDTEYFRERQHQQVELLRQQNFRDQHHLFEILYNGRTGIVAKQNQEIKEVSKAQQKIWLELKKINKSTTGSLAAIEAAENEPLQESVFVNRELNERITSGITDNDDNEEEATDSEFVTRLSNNPWAQKRMTFNIKDHKNKKQNRQNLLAASLQLRTKETAFNRKLPSLESILFRKEQEKAKFKIRTEKQKYKALLQRFNETFPEESKDDFSSQDENPDLRDSQVIQSAPAQLDNHNMKGLVSVNAYHNHSHIMSKGTISLNVGDIDKARDNVQKRLLNSGNEVVNHNLTDRQSTFPLKPDTDIRTITSRGTTSEKTSESTKVKQKTINQTSSRNTEKQSSQNETDGKEQGNNWQKFKNRTSDGKTSGQHYEQRKPSSNSSPRNQTKVVSESNEPGRSPRVMKNNPKRKNSLAGSTPNNISNKSKPILIRHVIKKDPIVATKPALPPIRESSQTSTNSAKINNLERKNQMLQKMGNGYISSSHEKQSASGSAEGLYTGSTDGTINKEMGDTTSRRNSRQLDHPNSERMDNITEEIEPHSENKIPGTAYGGGQLQPSDTNLQDPNNAGQDSKDSPDGMPISLKENVTIPGQCETKQDNSNNVNEEIITNTVNPDQENCQPTEGNDEKKVKRKKKKKGSEEPVLLFNHQTHNPDGSVRTVYELPDFQESLDEAMKARYLRLKSKQWYEKEMSNSEIFDQLKKKKSDTATDSVL